MDKFVTFEVKRGHHMPLLICVCVLVLVLVCQLPWREACKSAQLNVAHFNHVSVDRLRRHRAIHLLRPVNRCLHRNHGSTPHVHLFSREIDNFKLCTII